ncbi:hypothetical protein JXA34_03665 [Patescibacteria group bacterium]|nr:hypothetical protein [Patescibacteria group bacterium]
MVFASFIENPSKTHYDGEDKGERILYVMRSAFLTNYKWLTLTIIMILAPFLMDIFLATLKFDGRMLLKPGFIVMFTLFWYTGTFGYFLTKFLLWYFNVYIITTKKIVDMDFRGLFYKNISEATLDNIEDVTSTVKGTFGVVFNIGNVFIQTAAETREFEFEGVHDPAKVRDIISDLVRDIRDSYMRGKGFSRRGEILLKED